MSGQIRFFEKNNADYSNPLITVSATEASDLAFKTLNRSNLNSWITTGSLDANNTQFEVDFGEPRNIDTLILIIHNFKSFLVEYFDGFSFVGMPTPIDVTNCTDETSYFSFALTAMEKIRITIRGTQIADDDKRLTQFIATASLGQLSAWPVISNVKHDQNKQFTKMLSGRTNINRALGGFSFDMTVAVYKDSDDLAIIQNLFDAPDGFLVWINGGVSDQFSMSVKGYRAQDIYLMQCQNDLAPNFYQGIYSSGLGSFKVSFIEVTE